MFNLTLKSMLTTYTMQNIELAFLVAYRTVSILLLIVSALYLNSLDQLLSYSIFAIFSLITIAFTYFNKFIKNVLSLPYLYYTLLFLLFPLSFSVALSTKYVFGAGLGISLNISQEVIILGQLFLVGLWLSGAVALSVIPTAKRNQVIEYEPFRLRNFGIGPLYVASLLVFYFIYVDGLAFVDAKYYLHGRIQLANATGGLIPKNT
jgi:hypothetical protein